MMSAFGVDHPISKSWKKLGPKLARASAVARKTDTFPERMKVNYVQGRSRAGFMGGRHGVQGSLRRAEAPGTDAFGSSYKDINLEAAAKEKLKGKKLKAFGNASVTGYSNSMKSQRRLP